MFAAFTLVVTCIASIYIVSIIVKRIVSKIKFSQIGKPLPTPEENHIYIYLKWLFEVWYKAKDFKIANFEIIQEYVSLFRDEGLFHFRIGNIINYVFLFNAQSVQPILENAHIVKKDDFYVYFRPWLGQALFVNPEETWRKRRKLLTPAFHFRILDNFLPTMDEHSRNLVAKLKETEGKEWIDIVPFIANCSLDIICETAMGIEGKAQNKESGRFFKSMTIVCEIIVQRVFHIWSHYDVIFYLTSEGRKFKQHLKSMNKYILQVIEERKAALENNAEEEIMQLDSEEYCYDGKKKKPFLDIMLDSYFNNPDFTLEYVKDEVNGIMFGGLETTTYTGSWTLYLLGKHREIQRKVQEEIDEIFKKDPSRPITGEDLKKMKYLECVIKESMRLYPAGPITGRTLKEDVDCCGYTIRKGTHCVILIYHVHRDPNIFPDPEAFNPDRFLQENSIGRNPYSYIPFSAGIRNCIGQKFGMMELKTVLANVMKNLDVESLDMHVQPVLSVILRPYGPLRLRVKKRNKLLI